MKKVFITIFTLLILSTKAFSTDYYVTEGGVDADCLGAPCSVATFNTLIGDYSGHTFYFSGAITTTVVPQIYGSVGGYVTLDGYEAGNCQPLTTECLGSAEITKGASGYAGIYGDGIDYIIVQDFRIKSMYAVSGIHFSDGVDHLTIRRNYVHDGTKGIEVTVYGAYTNTYVTIGGPPIGGVQQGNKVENCGTTDGQSLVLLYFVDDLIVSYNELGITNKTDYGSEGLMFYTVNRGIAEYNKIYGLNRTNGAGERGLAAKGTNTDIIFRFNDITDCQDSGIVFINGVSGGYIYGNRVYGNDYAGIVLASQAELGPANAHLTNIHIWSNLIYNNGAIGLDITDYPCAGASCSISYVYAYNNTIANNGSIAADVSNAGLRVETGTYLTFINNIFYNNLTLGTGDQEIYSDECSSITLSNNLYHYTSGPAVLTGDGCTLTKAIDDDETNPLFASEYKLNGSRINYGDDKSAAIATVTIQGTSYNLVYDDALDPSTVDFTTNPPTVDVVDQDEVPGWQQGAWDYNSAISIPVRMMLMD